MNKQTIMNFQTFQSLLIDALTKSNAPEDLIESISDAVNEANEMFSVIYEIWVLIDQELNDSCESNQAWDNIIEYYMPDAIKSIIEVYKTSTNKKVFDIDKLVKNCIRALLEHTPIKIQSHRPSTLDDVLSIITLAAGDSCEINYCHINRVLRDGIKCNISCHSTDKLIVANAINDALVNSGFESSNVEKDVLNNEYEDVQIIDYVLDDIEVTIDQFNINDFEIRMFKMR